MFILNPLTQAFIEKFEHVLELYDPVPVGFTGVASQELPSVFSNEVDAYSIVYGFEFSEDPGDAQIWIRSTNPQYEWMAQSANGTPTYAPLTAIAGIAGQVLPVLPLVMPFILGPNGRIEMKFINASSGPLTGGIITLRRLKLINQKTP